MDKIDLSGLDNAARAFSAIEKQMKDAERAKAERERAHSNAVQKTAAATEQSSIALQGLQSDVGSLKAWREQDRHDNLRADLFNKRIAVAALIVAIIAIIVSIVMPLAIR